MKNSLIDQYVKRIENCLPKIMQGIRLTMPRQIMGIKLNFSQGLTLIRLGYHGPRCNMSELSKDTRIKLTALTGVIDGLIKEKLVKRADNPEDRRVVMVEITPLGQKIVNKIRRYRNKTIRHVVQVLNEKEREIIISGFEKMVNVFSSNDRP